MKPRTLIRIGLAFIVVGVGGEVWLFGGALLLHHPRPMLLAPIFFAFWGSGALQWADGKDQLARARKARLRPSQQLDAYRNVTVLRPGPGRPAA